MTDDKAESGGKLRNLSFGGGVLAKGGFVDREKRWTAHYLPEALCEGMKEVSRWGPSISYRWLKMNFFWEGRFQTGREGRSYITD